MQFRRNLLARLYRSPEPGDDGGGMAPAAPVTPDATAAPVEAGTTTPAPDTGKPGTMLEAMFGQKQEATPEETAAAAATGKTVQQLRDERGRFAAGKAEVQPDPLKPKVEGQPEDPTQMPEGLSPKAQQRFQVLANTNRELSAKIEEAQPIVESARALQATFHENGIKREQFEEAMKVVGLMNKGDLRGALAALDEQRALISMHLGVPIPGANALAQYPDLQQAVDNLQITEQHALEIARGRMVQTQGQQQARQQVQERQQAERQQQSQQQAQQAVHQGQLAVDAFCKARQTDDMDYARIEPLLLAQVKEGLLEGVPPQRWAALIQKTYGLIKQTAQSTRMAGPTTSVLRPTGGESPRQAPKTMHEAMWGAKP
jgi:hypothetical protein